MPRSSFANKINELEVSIAIEALLIADYPTSWTPARIDLDAPPSGFRDLGSVVEDSASFRVTREKFSLRTGLPRVIQYQAVMDLSGQFSVTLNSNSWRKVQFAFGNYSATCSPTLIGTVASVVDLVTFVTSSTSVASGIHIITASTTPAMDFPDAIEVRVLSTKALGGGLVEVKHTPPMKQITSGHLIGTYSFVKQEIGTRKISFYTLLGVADFIDGVQVVHRFHKVQPTAEWTEEFRPDQNGRVPLTFEALGVEDTVRGCKELVIADRFYFPGAICT